MNEDVEFDAVIQAGDDGGAFVFSPLDMLKLFGTTEKASVHGTVDGVPFTGKLLKYGFAQHVLGVLQGLRLKIGKKPGDTVKIKLRRVS